MVLTVIPEGIDLLLSEKQSMAQIVCNELAQLTWRSSADLFVYRLTHLRDLSESWQQFDQESGIECTVDEEPPAEASEIADQLMTSVQAADKENAVMKASGMVTRSKRSTSKPNSYSKVASTNTQSPPGLCDSKRSSKLVYSGKRRGRPPGSKNAPKNPVLLVKVKEEQHSDSDTDIAEPAESDAEMGAMQAASGNTSSTVQKDDSSGLKSRALNRTKYQCKECGLAFTLHSALLQHVLIHAGLGGDEYSQIHQGQTPATAPSHPAAHRCKTCGLCFTTPMKLQIHSRIHRLVCERKLTDDEGGVCPICDRKFRYTRCLIKHKRQHTGASIKTKMTLGGVLAVWLKQDPDIAQEIADATVFRCTECTRTFDNINMLCGHVRVHGIHTDRQLSNPQAMQVGDFKCKVCERQFLTEADLQAHYSETDSHECLQCGRRIGSALYLRVHRLAHKVSGRYRSAEVSGPKTDVDSSGPLVCPVCTAVIRKPEHLRQHMLVHSGVKRHICHICAKQFARQGQLKRHLLIHDGERQFECAKCNKRFLLRDMLRRHLRAVHERQRPHLCSLCGRPFAEKHQLRTHMKVHARNPNLLVVEPEPNLTMQ